MSEKSLSAVMLCGHCGNSAPMEVIARHSKVVTHSQGWGPDDFIEWDEGDVFFLLECPSCSGVLLSNVYIHSELEEQAGGKILYPRPTGVPRGLPPAIEKAYQAAQKVANIDANACGVLLGRVLDVVCDDRNAEGGTLHQRLGDLATKGEIPSNLVDVANGLRQLRNIGAHANLGELKEDDIPVLDSLCRAILEYVYSAPHIAREARSRLDELTSS